MRFLIATLLGALAVPPALGQMFVSTGNSSGLRMYYTGSNDWFLDPSAGRFDLRVNGGATPAASVDAAGAIKASSLTVTGAGAGAPFDLTTSSGVHILSGMLKLESGAWIQYGDGTVASSTSGVSATVYAQTVASSSTFIPSANFTNSTLGPCLAGSTITLTTGNNRVLVSFSGSGGNSTANSLDVFSLLQDGSEIASSNIAGDAGIAAIVIPNANNAEDASFTYLTPQALTAGSHSFCVTARTNSGTATLFGNTAGSSAAQLAAIEINTGGSSYSSPASSFTAITASQSGGNSSLGPCVSGSTVTLTTSGGPLLVIYSGNMGDSAGGTDHVGFLIDGAFPTNQSSGITSVDQRAGGVRPNASWTYRLAPGPAAGSHSICMTVATNSGGSWSVPASADPIPASFGAMELRVSAGAGDVASNGSNAFSGSNTFSGANTQTGSETFTNTSTFTVNAASTSFNGQVTFGSTLTYRGANGLGIGPGLMVLVSSAVFTTVTVATVTLPAPYKFFYVSASLNNATATNYTLYLTMGGDTANNYMWSNLTWDSGSGNVICNPSSFYAMTYTSGNTTYFKAGVWLMANLQVQIPASGSVLLSGDTLTTNPSSNPSRSQTQCIYSGSNQRTLSFMVGTTASCTSITQIASALTGTIYVYALPL